MREFTPSNGLSAPALRERARADGCLFFRGLLDESAVSEVRSDILRLCSAFGWLRRGADAARGVANPAAACVEPEPAFMKLYDCVMKLERFHALAHERPLARLFDDLFGEPSLVHARNIARLIFPRSVKHTTPPHQDFIHIQGAQETWTAWIPLGDCPRELGGLSILPGSHRAGVRPLRRSLGAGGLAVDADAREDEWQTTDYRSGDVAVFHSLTIHKGLPNLTSDRLRLSADFRYQPLAQPVTRESFLPHYARLTWEQVYEGWRSPAHQYYWKDLPLKYVDWSPLYHDAARK